MTHPPDDRGAELRELFAETSQELLQALNEDALKLEQHPGDEEPGDEEPGVEEIVRSIRRTVHTLKGDSAACGLRELSELAHQFEDALSLESAVAHAAVAEIALAAADLFGAMIAAYLRGGKLPATKDLRQRITQLTAAPAARKTGKNKEKAEPELKPNKELKPNIEFKRNIEFKPNKDWTKAEKLAMAKAQAAGLALYHVLVKIDPHCTMPIAGRQLIYNAILSVGQVLVMRPEPTSPAGSRQVEFVLGSGQPAETIAAKCRIPTIAADVSVSLVAAAAQPGVATKTSAPADTAISSPAVDAETESLTEESPVAAPPSGLSPVALENILRVEAGRIDSVLNLVGELIIGKSMLQQALNEFGKRYAKDPLRGRFADAMAFQARVLNDLQRSVMKIRMVPVEQLFRRFPRIVRDVARQCGHEVDLILSGEHTDLDKGILDAIAEPLTHLVRNAVSHGIEPAEERRRLGKPPRGTIRLNALHQGNQVVVEVSDDGRGIDADRIRAKAIELGMLTGEEAARLSDAETLDFIFRPGFSTAEQVTEVSGRGVGMDVVQSVLQRLKATIHVETRAGQGTTFRLKLPLTLAIIKALLFWVEQRLYAIPLNAVVEIARTTEDEVHQVDNYEVLQLRNQVLPVLRMGRPAPAEQDRKSRKLFVLVISVAEKRFGLIVDALEGEEELVIKALDDQTFQTDLVNGASILGDGKVVLILNLPAVVEHLARSRARQLGLASSGLLLTYADRARLVLGAAGGQA